MQVTASKKEITTMGTYSLLTLSIMVGFMYLNTFATEVLKIHPDTLATALLIAKLCDFGVSMFAGLIIEKVKIGNKGKNQTWLYYGRWVVAICAMLEVTNTTMLPMAVRVLVLSVSYTVLNCMMNLIQTAYYGVLAVVAGPNPANRNAMSIAMVQQSTVVTLICSFIPTLVTVLPFGSWNYFVVGTAFCAGMPWALGNISKLADGKDMPVGAGAAGAPQVTFKDMINCLIQDKQLLTLFLANTIMQTGTFMYQANYTYYFIYVVGDFTKLTVASLFSACFGLVAARIMPKIGVKLGKKWAYTCGISIFGLGLVGVYFLGPIHWAFYILCMSIGMCGTYLYQAFAITMYLDCGEVYLNKTGKDMRSIAMGLGSPPMKIAMAVGGTIGLKLLASTGFAPDFVPGPDWASKFMLVCWIVPALFYFAGAALMTVSYKITDAEAARCAQENAERMAKK